MSAEKVVALLACSLSLGAAAQAEEEPEIDAEFIEYLGMWQESDEEWLLYEEVQMTELDERSDPAPEGDESTETNDES